ncbi:UNVERIFIED_CONTAM: hypothetical protein GTU68_011246, partial [Idotea baltica]|nr:hypothetical protein [Idotea baltica]
KLIVLDRDGVINKDIEGPVVAPLAWEPIEGSLEAIARLNQAGYQVAVITNQSGIARDVLTVDDLHAVHNKMHEHVTQAGGRIETVVFCPHSESDECECRKPSPGMLYTLSERLNVDLAKVCVVGDSLKDIQAAMAAAAKPILVKTGKGEKTLESNKGLEHIPAYENLAAFVDDLLTPEDED